MKNTADTSETIEQKSAKLQEWALVAEIIGGIAVVISLGIVAYQINQSTKEAALNTNALEISAYQSLIESITHLNELFIVEPDLARIDMESRINPNGLTPQDRYRLRSFYTNLFRHGDMAYFQYSRGAIDIDRLNSVLEIILGYTNEHPFAYRRWEGLRDNFRSSGYVEHLDNMLNPPGK